MIRVSVRLACPPERAFEVFTNQIDAWWPTSRRHLEGKTVIRLDESGRFWEENDRGEFMDLGHVVSWEPGRRLVLEFFLGTGIHAPTLVTVRFQAIDAGTNVLVEHGPTEKSAELFEERAPAYQTSWKLVLQSLADHLDT